jgi:hypothetical protein
MPQYAFTGVALREHHRADRRGARQVGEQLEEAALGRRPTRLRVGELDLHAAGSIQEEHDVRGLARRRVRAGGLAADAGAGSFGAVAVSLGRRATPSARSGAGLRIAGDVLAAATGQNHEES